MIPADELAKQMDDIRRRLGALEARAGSATAADQARLTNLETALATHLGSLPSPGPVTQTLVLLDLSMGEQFYNSTTDVLAGTFTPPRTGGSYVIEAQIDARAEYWDNTVGAPRRGAQTVTTQGSSADQEWPQPGSGWGPGDRTTLVFRDTWSCSNATYNAKVTLTVTGANQLHVYGGYLRVTWTG